MPVYQEKDKSKWTKDGRKYYFKCYYIDKYGNKKRKQSKLYLNKKECEKAERDFLTKIEHKDIIEDNPSFENIYNEWWEYKKKSLKSTTIYSTKKILDKNFVPTFKEYKLHSIKINEINKLYQDMEKTNTSLKYQNKIIGYIQEFFQYAVENYNFDKKVASKIQKHRIETIDKKKDSEWNFWTHTEFLQFINNIENKFYYLLFTLLYYTGLRIGECIALNWNDINFTKKTLKINKTLTNKLGNGSYKIIAPKTKNSIRIIDLDDKLIQLLKDHFNNEKKIYGFNNDMFIFGNIKYTPQTTIARYLDKYIKKSNIKRITLHGFRHSHASLLIHLGLDFKDVAERLGDTVEIVQSTYYHMFPEKKSNTVNALNKLNSIKNGL